MDDSFVNSEQIVSIQTSPSGCPCGGPHLTRREVQVLRLAAAGLSSIQIGRRLRIASRTVDDYINAVLQRCAASSRSEAIARAYAAGVFVPGHWPPRWSGRTCLHDADVLDPSSGEARLETSLETCTTTFIRSANDGPPSEIVIAAADTSVVLSALKAGDTLVIHKPHETGPGARVSAPVPVHPGGLRSALTPERLAAAAARRAGGESVTSIARDLRIGRSTLYRALTSYLDDSTTPPGSG